MRRRDFVQAFGATFASAALLPRIPATTDYLWRVGLELYSVREGLKKDLDGTVKAVAQMGYQCVEFYAPYWEWTEAQTKDMRKLLDDLGETAAAFRLLPDLPARPIEKSGAGEMFFDGDGAHVFVFLRDVCR